MHLVSPHTQGDSWRNFEGWFHNGWTVWKSLNNTWHIGLGKTGQGISVDSFPTAYSAVRAAKKTGNAFCRNVAYRGL